MIQPHEQAKLNELKAQVKCPKGCQCIDMALEDLCKAEYHPRTGFLECMECRHSCIFATPFASTHACTCPLRMYIAKHFDQWSAESTSVLRQAPKPV